MANVLFKRGLQANLFKEGFTAQDGTFYLTEDSHRLYVGQGEQLVELNRYIKEVATSTDLSKLTPENGDFVWVKEGNMLLVCTDKAATGLSAWTQINPPDDTNDDTAVTGGTGKIEEVKDGEGKKKLVFTIGINQTKTDVDGKTTTITPVEFSFDLTEDLLGKITSDVSIGVGATVDTAANKATVNTEGTGSNENGFTISGAGDITISGSADNIVIEGKNTTYDLGSAAGTTNITLSGSDSTNDNVIFEAGKQIALDGATAGKIGIAHGTITTKDPVVPENAKTIDATGIQVLTGVELDNGHVTQLTYDKFVLPEDNDTTYRFANKTDDGTDPIIADNTGKITITLVDSEDKKVIGVSEQDLYYTIGGVKVYNQGELNVYTKDEIDAELKGINAMVYRGTVTNGQLPPASETEGVKNGYTYMVASDDTYNGIEAKTGDLLIASGTENENGYLDTITWNLVPAGNDIDTQYALQVANNTITLRNTTAETDAGSAVIGAGKNATVTESDEDIAVSTVDSKIQISHKKYNDPTATEGTALTPVAGSGKFTIISDIEASNGHITGFTTQEVTLPEDKDTKYDLVAAAGENGAAPTITLKGADDSNDVVSFEVGTNANGQSLEVSGAEGKITYKHKDYTFTNPTGVNGGDVAHGGVIKVVSGATVENGHITGLSTVDYTLPSDIHVTDHTFNATTLALSEERKGVKLESTVINSDDSKPADNIQLVSSSLQFTNNTSGTVDTVDIDIVWGTF